MRCYVTLKRVGDLFILAHDGELEGDDAAGDSKLVQPHLDVGPEAVLSIPRPSNHTPSLPHARELP